MTEIAQKVPTHWTFDLHHFDEEPDPDPHKKIRIRTRIRIKVKRYPEPDPHHSDHLLNTP